MYLSSLLLLYCSNWVCFWFLEISRFESETIKNGKEVSLIWIFLTFRSFRKVADIVQARLKQLTPKLILSLWHHVNQYPKTLKPLLLFCVKSFVLRFDLIASDVNQCDSLIGKSRLFCCESRLIGFDWSPAKSKPLETIDWLLSLIINNNYTYNRNQVIQDSTTLELAIRIHSVKG